MVDHVEEHLQHAHGDLRAARRAQQDFRPATLGNLRVLPLDRAIPFGPVGVVWSRDHASEAVRLFVEHITQATTAQ
ncbi:hypothetical protein [Paracidovorax oryzae]|uniref:hypothetical protein n=1 Tax=Paracidovorax oryzae TaxID=862720 RepID=UPI00047CE83E|nr:hypothetical protein [Paracidovorax oryzae]